MRGKKKNRGGEEKREKKRTETMQRKKRGGGGRRRRGWSKGRKEAIQRMNLIDLSEIEIIESLGG